MGDSKTLSRAAVLALVLAVSLLTGCAMLQLKLRAPGQFNKGFPEEVALEYDCDKRPLPWFKVEATQLLPEKMSAGEEFNHRLEYVMCPVETTQVVHGTMHTRVLYRGKPILTETLPHDLLPGRWVLDSFITLPVDAKPGIYALQSVFKSVKGSFEAKSTFLVEGDE